MIVSLSYNVIMPLHTIPCLITCAHRKTTKCFCNEVKSLLLQHHIDIKYTVRWDIRYVTLKSLSLSVVPCCQATISTSNRPEHFYKCHSWGSMWSCCQHTLTTKKLVPCCSYWGTHWPYLLTNPKTWQSLLYTFKMVKYFFCTCKRAGHISP